MWDARKPRILAVVREKAEHLRKSARFAADDGPFHAHDFGDALDGLGAEMVDEQAYLDAASAGTEAVPRGGVDAQNVADIWIGHVRQYANKVPGRAADALAATANDAYAAADPTRDLGDQIVAAIDAKIEALRSSITRYAKPMWGTGQQGYGDSLGVNGVLLVWELGADEDHCSDCIGLADGSPYQRGDVPTWPGAGDTACRDNCYCSIVADDDTFNSAFGGDE